MPAYHLPLSRLLPLLQAALRVLQRLLASHQLRLPLRARWRPQRLLQVLLELPQLLQAPPLVLLELLALRLALLAPPPMRLLR